MNTITVTNTSTGQTATVTPKKFKATVTPWFAGFHPWAYKDMLNELVTYVNRPDFFDGDSDTMDNAKITANVINLKLSY